MQYLTAVSGNAPIIESTINSTSHRVDSEDVVIHTAVWRNAAVVCELITSSSTCHIPLFTDGSDDVIVHTFLTIRWRMETDHS